MKNKNIYLVLAGLLVTSNLYSLSLSEIEGEVTKEEKPALIKKSFKYSFFNTDEKTRRSFLSIQKHILEGDYKTAKEKGVEFYNRANSLNEDNELNKQLANIALGNVYKAMGEVYKWKYMHLSALDYFIKLGKDKNNILNHNDYTFGMYELSDILLETKPIDQVKEMFIKINLNVRENKFKYPQKLFNISVMKFNLINAKIEYKRHNKEGMLNYFSRAEDSLKKVYTYYSLNEAHLIFDRAQWRYELTGKTDRALEDLKQAFIISKKILNKMNLSDRSVFLGDIYFSIGNILSSGTKQEEALDYLKKAREIFINTNSNTKELNAIFQIINSYKILNKNKLSEEYIKLAKEKSKKYFGDKSVEYADSLIAEADLINTVGDYREALKIMEKAKLIYIDKFGLYSREVKMLNSTLNYIKLKED